MKGSPMRKTVVKKYAKTPVKAKSKTKKSKPNANKILKIRMYKTYQFTVDPVMDEVLNLMESQEMAISQASENSGVSRSTISNWMRHKTRRPQSATIEAVGRACGYRRTWTKI